jgi:hypothetical protein
MSYPHWYPEYWWAKRFTPKLFHIQMSRQIQETMLLDYAQLSCHYVFSLYVAVLLANSSLVWSKTFCRILSGNNKFDASVAVLQFRASPWLPGCMTMFLPVGWPILSGSFTNLSQSFLPLIIVPFPPLLVTSLSSWPLLLPSALILVQASFPYFSTITIP